MIESTCYSALRNLKNIGDFRVAKPLKLLQNQDFSVFVPECVE